MKDTKADQKQNMKHDLELTKGELFNKADKKKGANKKQDNWCKTKYWPKLKSNTWHKPEHETWKNGEK